MRSYAVSMDWAFTGRGLADRVEICFLTQAPMQKKAARCAERAAALPNQADLPGQEPDNRFYGRIGANLADILRMDGENYEAPLYSRKL